MRRWCRCPTRRRTTTSSARLKRVLLVAYYFPPQPKAGALRPSFLARHLPAFGWEPTVLTVDYPGDVEQTYRVIRIRQRGRSAKTELAAPSERPRRRSRFEQWMRELARSIVYFPDDAVGWLRPARAAALALTSSERFDALVSTAPPPSAHFVARAVADARHIPWIADYRDLWSGPPGPYFDREFGPVRRAIFYALER